MSSSEGDIDDELLELAGEGATERKRKRSQQNTSSKRRKADHDDVMESDAGNPESEEETETNPYPLENKFVDEEDRARLMEMSEIEREAILAQRQDEIQRFTDKRQLDQMFKQQSGRGGAEDNVSKAAKRQHPVRGATREKSRKLDELKARRRAKDEKKRTRTNSPKRDRSSSPMDMEVSDEDEEDGQFTKYDEEEERDRRLLSKLAPAPEEEPPITLEDLKSCRLTRAHITRYCMAPWFDEFVKGTWVRYLIGVENGGNQPVYRICEVTDLSATTVKPYKVDEQTVNQEIELRHGDSTRFWPMDKVSNGEFDQREFDRLVKTCENEKVKLPTKRQLEKKAAQLKKFIDAPMTESDIAAILARKQAINASKQSPAFLTMERSRLQQARTLAIRRQDYTEVATIDTKLAEVNAALPARDRGQEGSSDILAKLNERNRKLNQEQVRKAERAEMERKRRERQLRAGTSTPTAADRLKAKMLGADANSRPGTPGVGGSTPRSVSPAGTPSADTQGTTNGARSFEASVLQSVEIDLGDF
ncbi:plus-3-domain-containing protein [Fomes fomentarius]|nr:plus-3-domain-containing protein [Fomes fomentarius]